MHTGWMGFKSVWRY